MSIAYSREEKFNYFLLWDIVPEKVQYFIDLVKPEGILVDHFLNNLHISALVLICVVFKQ